MIVFKFLTISLSWTLLQACTTWRNSLIFNRATSVPIDFFFFSTRPFSHVLITLSICRLFTWYFQHDSMRVIRELSCVRWHIVFLGGRYFLPVIFVRVFIYVASRSCVCVQYIQVVSRILARCVHVNSGWSFTRASILRK